MRNLLKLTFVLLFGLSVNAQIAPPAARFIITTPAYCTGVPITFSSVSTGASLSYTWAVVSVKGLTSYSHLNSNTLSLTFTNTQTYTVYLNVSNSAGISVSFTTITISKQPKASFNASFTDATSPKNQLILTNYSTFATKNYWVFDNNFTQKDSSLNASRNYNAGGNYSVMLIAKGTKGCSDTSRYAFTLSETSSLVLPNVFTPNGDDINDVYKPITIGISKLTANVFNRYGVLMGSWDKVNGFWDGHTTAGEPCSSGEYFIVVEAEGYDLKTYKLKGNITLVR